MKTQIILFVLLAALSFNFKALGQGPPTVTDTVNIFETDSFIGCQHERVKLTCGERDDAMEYYWEPGGQTTFSIDVNITRDSVTYIGTRQEGLDSTRTDTITVWALKNPNVNLGPDTSICQGDSVLLDAGPGFESYDWSTGDTTQTIKVGKTDLYSVTVRDKCGQQATDEIDVTVDSLPAVDLGSNLQACGSAVLENQVSPGTSDYSYLWSTGDTTQSIEVTESGAYSLTITDINTGCTNSDTVEVTIYSQPEIDLGPDTSLCAGEELLLDAGSGFEKYTWEPSGVNAQSILVTSTNTYSVSAVDSNGCKASDTIYVNISDPVVDLGGPYQECGSIVLENLEAAQPDYVYSWSTGATTETLEVSGEMTDSLISLEVSYEAGGCSDADTTSVSLQPAPQDINLGNDTSICEGDSILLDAGSGFESYLWEPTGDTTQTIYAKKQASYRVTGIDSNGCESSDTIFVMVSTTDVELGGPYVACGSKILEDTTTSSPGESYIWSTGDTTSRIEVTVSDSYSLTVSDKYGGCKASDGTSVTIHDKPEVDLGNDTSICEGDTLVLDAGSGTDYSYEWAPGGQTTQTIDVTREDSYSVTVTDNFNNCSSSDTIMVNVKPLPTVNLGKDQTVCGSTVLDAGTGFADYVWSTGATTQTIEVTSSDSYAVTVTDSVGCSNSDTTNITVKPSPNVDLGEDRDICEGNAALLDAGDGYSSYKWEPNGETTQIIAASSTGTYSVTVTDTNNCEGIDSVYVTVHPKPVVDLGADTTVCGSVTLDAGSDYLQYEWAPNGETTQTITVTDSGSYSVTVTDNYGCKGRDTINVAVNEIPQVDVLTTETECGDSTGTATASVSGGSGTYSFQWDENTGNQKTKMADSLPGGIYYVTVNDGYCTQVDDGTVNETGGPTVTIDPSSAEICTGESIALTASGADAYVWSPATGLDDTTGANVNASPLSTTTYAVEGTTDGCSGYENITVTVNPLPTVNLGADTSICTTESLVLDAGSEFTSYLWSDNSTSQTLLAESDSEETTEYWVKVTDDNGCEARDSITVIFESCVDINNNKASVAKATVYPNPSNGNISLKLEGMSGTIQASIFTTNGIKVFEEEVYCEGNICTIPLQLDLQQGKYVLKLSREDSSKHMNIIIE